VTERHDHEPARSCYLGDTAHRNEPLAVIQVLPHRTSHDQIELSAPFGLDQVGKSVINPINLRQRMGCHTGIPNFSTGSTAMTA